MRACHDVVVASSVLALAARFISVTAHTPADSPSKDKATVGTNGHAGRGGEGSVPGGEVLDGCCVVVRALSALAVEMAARTCTAAGVLRPEDAAGAEMEALEEEEDRRRVVTWLELVALQQGEGVGLKMGAVMLSGAG